MGSTEILDRVKQTEGPSRTDFAKSGIINEPASSGDTPPSSDSGVHSLGEQWENMSTSSMDTASEQNNRQTHGNVSGRRVSDSRVPPNTEKDEDINYPWMDCVLNKGLDDNVSIDIQHKDRKIQYNGMTVCENEYSSMDSGTDGVNSDIGALADFSDDDEETRIEQPSGCRIPGCQCEGHIEIMEWDSDDMTETDDSEYDDPMDRANRLYVENYNYDLSEGMTPMTYTPPLRRNRRRRYEVRKTKEADLVESVSVTGDWDFQADMGSPESEPMVQPRTVVDENIQDVSDNIDVRGCRPRTGNDQNIYSDEDSDLFDRPVAGSATVGAWQDGPSKVHGINVGRMVIEEMTEMASDEANFSEDNYPGPVKQIAREMRRAWVVNNALPVEERESCRIPGCQCNGRADYMDWNSDDMSETDYSDYEETEADVIDSIGSAIDDEFLTDEALPNSEQPVQINTVTDKDIWTVSNRKDNRGGRTLTGSDEDITSEDNSKLFDRPVTGSATAWAGTDTDNPHTLPR